MVDKWRRPPENSIISPANARYEAFEDIIIDNNNQKRKKTKGSPESRTQGVYSLLDELPYSKLSP